MIEIRSLREPVAPAQQRIGALLEAHAVAQGHPFSMRELALEAWDGETYLGGLTGKFIADWAYVELLAVSDAARGRGIGRRLLEALESEARASGLIGIWLDTFAFQAPDFYRKLGFAEFGRIADHPAGQARLFFQKRIDTA